MNEPLDVVSLLIALIALIASKEIAHLVGPYIAIFVLACTGSALSLSGTERKIEFWPATWYIFVRVMLAVSITVSIAELLQNVIPWAKPRYTLVPLALGIGWIRDYNHVRDFFGQTIGKWLTRKADQ